MSVWFVLMSSVHAYNWIMDTQGERIHRVERGYTGVGRGYSVGRPLWLKQKKRQRVGSEFITC